MVEDENKDRLTGQPGLVEGGDGGDGGDDDHNSSKLDIILQRKR